MASRGRGLGFPPRNRENEDRTDLESVVSQNASSIVPRGRGRGLLPLNMSLLSNASSQSVVDSNLVLSEQGQAEREQDVASVSSRISLLTLRGRGRGIQASTESIASTATSASTMSLLGLRGQMGRGLSMSRPRPAVNEPAIENEIVQPKSITDLREESEADNDDQSELQASTVSSTSTDRTSAYNPTTRGRGIFLPKATPKTGSSNTQSTVEKKDSQSETFESDPTASASKEKLSKPSTSLGRGTGDSETLDRKADPGVKPKTSERSGSEAESQKVPVIKHGIQGKKFMAMTNCMKLNCDPEMGVFEYQVDFSPTVDNVVYRSKYLRQHRDALGISFNGHVFNGVLLAVPKRLTKDRIQLKSESLSGGSDVMITITYKRQRRISENIQLFNDIFERIFKKLEFLRVGRKNFDPRSPILVPQHKLAIWPGYVKAVDELENGVFLTLDVSSRILSTRTVLEEMKTIYQTRKDTWKEDAKKRLLGKF